MALLTSYSDANKVVTEGETVRYSATPTMYGDGDSAFIIYWTITRYCSMRYSYVGMTRAAAESCAKDMRDEYTRLYHAWQASIVDVNGSPEPVIVTSDEFKCSSTCAPSQDEGDAWRVDVSVEEEDTIISGDELKTIEDLEAAFQIADTRSGTGKIAVVSARWDSTQNQIVASFNKTISLFDITKLGVDVKSGSTYAAATVASYSAADGTITFVATANKTFRLNYNSGAVVSKDWTTHTPVTPVVEITDASIAEVTSGDGNYTVTLRFRSGTDDWTLDGCLNSRAICAWQSKGALQYRLGGWDFAKLGDNDYQVKASVYSADSSGQVTIYLRLTTAGFEVDSSAVTLAAPTYSTFALKSVPNGTTVTPSGGTIGSGSGYKIDWDWGDGTVETGLTAMPSAHTYSNSAATDYTIKVTGYLTEIHGDYSGDTALCFLGGAEPYLRSVELSEFATTLGDYAFANCDSMETMTGSGVTSLGEAAFMTEDDDNEYACVITLPKLASITGINAGAFYNLNGGTVNFSLLQTLGSSAFVSCSGMTVYASKASVTVQSHAITNCSLMTIYFNKIGETPTSTVISATLASDAFYNNAGRSRIYAMNSQRATVSAATGYSWGLHSGSTIYCSDGIITVS